MKNIFNALLLLVAITLFSQCAKNKIIEASYDNPDIYYTGRIDTISGECINFYWSGSSAKINFYGTSASVVLADSGDNYYNVIIDNDSIILLWPETEKTSYKIAENLPAGNHTIELFKRTEWDRGNTQFYGFVVEGPNAEIKPKDKEKPHKIEFYGNSITAGYAVDDLSGSDRSDSIFTNFYKSYAYLTARSLNADYSIICKSGIGITISWFPIIMSEIYDRINPADSTSKWDFSLYTPDIVVVNLFQNDSWLVNLPEREEFKNNFGTEPPTDAALIKAYRSFISGLKAEYPNSKIICMLGNMDITQKDSKWPGIVQQAVHGLNDSLLYTHFVPFKESPGHPTEVEQQILANSLVQFIQQEVGW